MKINLAINEGSKILNSKFIPNPLLDAEILMAQIINKDRNYILLNYNNPINKNDLIIPMDSPIQKNFIYKYCFEKEKMEKIFQKVANEIKD